ATNAILFTYAPSFCQEVESIKIGFLIRDKGDLAVQQAAELAIDYANAKGGYKGTPFELITKSCDGPWGIGSKQAVDLIFEEEVPILLGALDGRNAHLAEQVTAKSHVVMLSTLSSDPTLSRAYVPWYFRMVPDDKQQAKVLVEEIYHKNKAKKVAVVSFDHYDGKMSADAMEGIAKEKKFHAPEIFVGLGEQDLLEKITKNPWDAVVLSGTSTNASEIINKLKSSNRNLKIYAFLNLFNFMDEYQPKPMENIKFVSSFEMNDLKWLSFEKAYHAKYDKYPSPSLAFVYDGIMLSIEAIKKFGPNSEAIRNGFKALEYEGITGEIEFDKLGDRVIEWRLVQLIDENITIK
ncbi:MAG: ABC transporter substrate-binding protein, partial [Cyclobacteriaceae bacterium]|nr:ABC transporter substrate-binding protein [Cyclobacteriaceae bacterium]